MEGENIGLLMDNLMLARKVQALASSYLCEGKPMQYTNVDEWQEMQRELAQCMNALVRQDGSTSGEEAEIVLAILMGYTLAVRNPLHIDMALERAERVLPRLDHSVLKCQLMAFCYAETGDEELADSVSILMQSLKAAGNGEEIRWVEELLNSVVVD